MTAPKRSVVFWDVPYGTSTVIAVGNVVIPDTTASAYQVATTANRGTRRSEGIAMTAFGGAGTGTVEIQSVGTIDASISGLTAGSASWVRCSATGTIERFTPAAGSSDIIGYAEADGRVHLCFGVLTETIVTASGGGGGGTPGGSSGDVQYNNAGAFGGITPTATGAVLRATGATSSAFGALDLANAAARTGVLPAANQADQTMAGDVTGTTGASVVSKVRGATVNTAGGALTTGNVLKVTGVATIDYGAVNLAGGANHVTGALPLANQAAPTGTGFATTTTGAWDAASTGAARWTGSRIQIDNPLQFNNAGQVGNISFTPTATRTHTVPDVADDTFALLAASQTLTTKTINATNNTITDTSTAAGDLLKSNGTKFVRFARGASANLPLTVNGANNDLTYQILPVAGGGTGVSSLPGSTGELLYNNGGALGATTGVTFAATRIRIGTTPTNTDGIGLINNTGVYFRNAGNTANINALQIDSGNNLRVGDASSAALVMSYTSTAGIFNGATYDLLISAATDISLALPVRGASANSVPFRFKDVTVTMTNGSVYTTASAAQYECPYIMLTGGDSSSAGFELPASAGGFWASIRHAGNASASYGIRKPGGAAVVTMAFGKARGISMRTLSAVTDVMAVEQP